MRSDLSDGESDRVEQALGSVGAPQSLRSFNPFFAAMSMTHQPMVLTDPSLPDHPLVFVNDAFCRLTGYLPGELLGRNCRMLQGPETQQSEVDRMRSAIAAQTPIELELLNYRKDGRPFWNRLQVSPVFDDDGRLTYFFASQSDITGQVEADRRFREMNEILERRVAEALAGARKG